MFVSSYSADRLQIGDTLRHLQPIPSDVEESDNERDEDFLHRGRVHPSKLICSNQRQEGGGDLHRSLLRSNPKDPLTHLAHWCLLVSASLHSRWLPSSPSWQDRTPQRPP